MPTLNEITEKIDAHVAAWVAAGVSSLMAFASKHVRRIAMLPVNLFAKAVANYITEGLGIAKLQEDVDFIKKQIVPMRQDVFYLLDKDKIEFRRDRRPRFLCTLAGANLAATQGYFDLLRVPEESMLRNRNWRQFIEPTELGEYITAFQTAAVDKAPFNYEIGMRDSRNESIGRYLIRAEVYGPEDRITYIGEMTPADETAEEIYQRRCILGSGYRKQEERAAE